MENHAIKSIKYAENKNNIRKKKLKYYALNKLCENN